MPAWSRAAALAALLFGLIVGSYEIANTSIGWHLASGHLILDEGKIPDQDPFSFTAEGHPWVDHEWGFQLIAALAERLGGEAALVALRALLVALLAVLLYHFGVRSGLDPPAALLLTALAIYGARIRFYLRPELFTLLLVGLGVWIFLNRHQGRLKGGSTVLLVLVMVLGINLHGAILVLPILLGGILLGELITARKDRAVLVDRFASGCWQLLLMVGAAMINPYGWHVLVVPFELARLVGLPQVPNPEWISPTPADLPSLYVAMGLGLLILVLGERDPRRWLLYLMGGALAVRYVRNVGIFFTLFPLMVAPTLARLPNFAPPPVAWGRRRAPLVMALLLVGSLAVAILLEPRHILHMGLSESRYPLDACRFMEREGLLDTPMYNDVRYGGYLIHRYFPERKVFIDDRNEIHIDLLTEIYEIFQTSDVGAWKKMLARYGIETALLRYNPSFEIQSPDGEVLGRRGFSALWFPSSDWALVYWDDAAMVFVRRPGASPELLERCEYHLIRPDDLDQLMARLRAQPEIARALALELRRALEESRFNERALDVSRHLLRDDPP